MHTHTHTYIYIHKLVAKLPSSTDRCIVVVVVVVVVVVSLSSRRFAAAPGPAGLGSIHFHFPSSSSPASSDTRAYFIYLCEELKVGAMASVGRGLTSPLLTITFLLCLVGAALAGWALNRNLDSTRNGGQGAVGKWNLPSLKPAFSYRFSS
jgi:hypothetical protein